MGLDMYLTAHKFIWKDEDRDKLKEFVKNLFPNLSLKPETIVFEVTYWRKSNEIHKWFVDNVQKGVDDCGDYHVSEEDLRKLLNDVEEVLNNREKAEELLPTQSGFFFGGTEYDEYYWQGLEETRDKLKEILQSDWIKEVDLYYHSSW